MTMRSWSTLRMLSTFLDSGEHSFQLLVLIPFFNTNHCSPEEKFDCYMLTAGVMTCGGIEFKTKGRDDQASRSHTSNFSSSSSLESNKAFFVGSLILILHRLSVRISLRAPSQVILFLILDMKLMRNKVQSALDQENKVQSALDQKNKVQSALDQKNKVQSALD